jgi:23S rRNA (uracil1939-C5)-methyltransferase
LPYELQWKTKLTGVRQALEKAQVKLSCELEELPAERIWEYRNRIQLNGRKDEIGFFAAGSNALVPIERCEIARPELNEKISALKKEGNALSKPYKVETEVLENGEVRAAWNQGHAAMGFRQIHDEQNQKLRQWVQSAIDGHDGGIFDLFGGDGNLSLSLAQGNPSRPIFCVDHTVPDENEQKRFPSNLQFERASILKWVKKQNCRSGPWATILDPPRVGLADDHAQIAQELERLNVNRVVAVGCDVDSWVRDVRKWSERGWKLARVGVLDLFPQTSHVESLALLLRE